MKNRRFLGALGAIAIVAAACGGGGSPKPSLPTSIGAGEGELNLIIWAGYAERGEVDPAYDWVTPFETATGCTVNTTDMTDSNNGVSLMQSGDYDGISASGDATTRLIAGGIAAPVNTTLLEKGDGGVKLCLVQLVRVRDPEGWRRRHQVQCRVGDVDR